MNSYLPLLLAPFIGSFLGTLVVRLPADRPVVFDRSRCETCARTLCLRDVAPISSWLFLKGRCRHCGAELSLF